METNKDGGKVLFKDCTWRELEAADRSSLTLVLPSGSLEEHGPHMTLANDSSTAEAVALAAAREVPGCLVLPCLWYTPCLDTSNYTGTVGVGTSTFIEYLADILESLYRQGFKKLVVANVHGGAKTALDAGVREFHHRMRTRERGYADDFFLQVHNVYAPAAEYLESIKEGRDWGHAGEMETSVEMFLAPERVNLDEAVEEYIPWQKGFEWYIGDMRAVNESGVHGDARKASAEKGEKIFGKLVEGLVDILSALRG